MRRSTYDVNKRQGHDATIAVSRWHNDTQQVDGLAFCLPWVSTFRWLRSFKHRCVVVIVFPGEVTVRANEDVHDEVECYIRAQPRAVTD
jgi:hypothetical protein